MLFFLYFVYVKNNRDGLAVWDEDAMRWDEMTIEL